jgi:LPS-assembly lipoprotein
LVCIILLPLLAACGFEPLYGDHLREGTEPQLAAIKIMPIKEHIGQLLEWRLEKDFNPSGDAVRPRYALHVALSLRQDFLATQPDAVSTRGTISAAADCALTTLDNKTILYRGKIQSIADYNIDQDAYAAEIGKSSAEKRVVEDIGEEIETRIAVYFRERTAGK